MIHDIVKLDTRRFSGKLEIDNKERIPRVSVGKRCAPDSA